MPINLDFGEVGKLPEEGTYLVRCKLAELKKGPSGPYIKTNFEIMGPTNEGFSNLWLNMSFTPQSLWATQRNLEALTGQEFREDNMTLDENDLPGLMCGAIITHGEFDGQAKAQIEKLVPYDVAEATMHQSEPTSSGFSFEQSDEKPF